MWLRTSELDIRHADDYLLVTWMLEHAANTWPTP